VSQSSEHYDQLPFNLKGIHQYLLPFGLWLVFAYADVFRRAGAHICPIGGEEKVGIVEPIKVKRGEKALEREDVTLSHFPVISRR